MSAVIFGILLAASCAAAPAGSGDKARPGKDELDVPYHRTAGLRDRLLEVMAALRPEMDRVAAFQDEYEKASDVQSLDALRERLHAPFKARAEEFFRLRGEFVEAKQHFEVMSVAAATEKLRRGPDLDRMPRHLDMAIEVDRFQHDLLLFKRRIVRVDQEDLAAVTRVRERLSGKERNRRIALLAGIVCLPGLAACAVIRLRRHGETPGSAAATIAARPDPLRPPFAPGTLLEDNFRIERELGRDELGVIFEASDVSLGRKVSLKRMHEGAALSERDLQAFLRKVQTAASLKHPNIVEIYAIVNDGPMPCPVFELVEGKPLSRVLAHGPLPLAAAKSVVRQVAAALEHAHGRGVFHGSLKPSSILVKADGTAKVTDFGVAPGQASKEADLFALGACAYELLTGRRPSPQPVPGIPPAAEAFMSRALHPDPRQRFRSAAELAEAFEALG